MITTQKSSDVRELRPLALALYAVAAMLVLIPLTEFAGQLGWTAQPNVLNWRTGSVGLLSGAVLTPTVGLLLAVIAAAVFGHRGVARALAVIAAVTAVLLLLVIGIFILDVLQLRPNVVPAMQRNFTMAAVKALINFSLTTMALVAISISAFRLTRRNGVRGEAPARAPLSNPSRGTQAVQGAQ